MHKSREDWAVRLRIDMAPQASAEDKVFNKQGGGGSIFTVSLCKACPAPLPRSLASLLSPPVDDAAVSSSNADDAPNKASPLLLSMPPEDLLLLPLPLLLLLLLLLLPLLWR
jgi:hypothetical protein